MNVTRYSVPWYCQPTLTFHAHLSICVCHSVCPFICSLRPLPCQLQYFTLRTHVRKGIRGLGPVEMMRYGRLIGTRVDMIQNSLAHILESQFTISRPSIFSFSPSSAKSNNIKSYYSFVYNIVKFFMNHNCAVFYYSMYQCILY